jgi:hypothetical protein
LNSNPKLVASFPIRIRIQIWGIIKGISKVNLVNQEWHLVKDVMVDSMMPLGEGVITKYSPIK